MPVGRGNISVRNVVRRYGNVVAADHLNVEIEHGEFVTLLGPSGCGKTTLLRMIGGFDEPDSGSIHLGDDDITMRPPERRALNMVFQRYALFPHLNVADNVAYGLRNLGISGGELADRVRRGLSTVNMSDYASRFISQLSGGQQQRVAVARALVNEPLALLLDEPLSALDRQLRQHMQSELRTLQKRLGITFVFVTHDQEEALALSDRVVVMRDGRIEQVGSPEEIYDTPANSFVASFVGESTLIRACRDRSSGRVAAIPATMLPDLQMGHVVVRPEHWQFQDDGHRISMRGIVRERIFLGSFTRYIVDLEEGVTAKANADQAFGGIGDQVTLHLNLADCWFLSDA